MVSHSSPNLSWKPGTLADVGVGSHPAVDFMFKNLLARRERLHEVASRRHRQVLEELARVRDMEKESVWTWWTVSPGLVKIRWKL